MMDIETVRNR